NGARRRVQELHAAIASGELQLDADVLGLDALRQTVMATTEAVVALRARTETLDATIKDARGALDAIRAIVSELDIARVTAEADLSHLAHTCEDAVNATLDEVIAEIDRLEREGHATPDASAIIADESEDGDDADADSESPMAAGRWPAGDRDLTTPDAAVVAAQQRAHRVKRPAGV